MSTPSNAQYDAIILGAGAAGLMCAIEAGRRGRRVVVLEHNERPGRKILISGGGRCNFTNINCQPENFVSENKHFAKSALARYGPADFVTLVERHRIPYHEKTLGQLFCHRSAADIVAMLETECRGAQVRIVCHARITAVDRAEDSCGNRFHVLCNEGVFQARSLVVATGGLSIPKIGASGMGYDLARQFGLRIVPTRPALVPLTFSHDDLRVFGKLAGVSAESIVSADNHAFREKLLFTHRGLSGPAVLQASLYQSGTRPVRVNLLPDITFADEEKHRWTTADVRKQLRRLLPNRLADSWLENWLTGRTPQLSDKSYWSAASLRQFERELCEWTIWPAGNEGYGKAEVTAGGVDTNELSSTTMECLRVPGLYFVGEVVDVTGQLGGYNFQWAWASGAAAGRIL